MAEKKPPMVSKKNLERKKAAVIGGSSRKRTPLFVGAVAAVVLIGGVFGYMALSIPDSATTTSAPQQPVSSPKPIAPTTISHPVQLFGDGKVRHFEHRDGSVTIRYFVLKSSDGVLRAAFDACNVCWPEGKGYYQDGDEMVCRNCGRRFASVLINEVKGGCNPAPLNRRIQGDRLVISIEDIKRGRSYFNFSGKA